MNKMKKKKKKNKKEGDAFGSEYENPINIISLQNLEELRLKYNLFKKAMVVVMQRRQTSLSS